MLSAAESGRTVLFISNGHGEDLAAAMIARCLKPRAEGRGIRTAGFPLVGKGKPYVAAGVEVVAPTFELPSGGFAKHGLRLLARDVAAGLPSVLLRQARAAPPVVSSAAAVIVVGDTYALLWSRWADRAKVLFLSTAKSSYIRGHTVVDTLIMRRRAAAVLARDERTAVDLRRAGVPATFVGNILMDAFDVTGENFGLSLEGKVVGILPGSRLEAYDNMTIVAPAVEMVAERLQAGASGSGVEFVLALAPSLDAGKLAATLRPLGWTFQEARRDPSVAATNGVSGARGVLGWLVSERRDRRAEPGVRRVEVTVVSGAFGDVLNVCDVFVGLAGTANEQAAGMGKPVVAFPGVGPQFNRRFALAQKRLLGDSLRIVDASPQAVAGAVLEILGDAACYRRMRDEGRLRMGGPGACDRVVDMVRRYLESGVWTNGANE